MEAQVAGGVRAYISIYRTFSESFSSLLKNIMAEENVSSVTEDISALLLQTPRYVQLLLCRLCLVIFTFILCI